MSLPIRHKTPGHHVIRCLGPTGDGLEAADIEAEADVVEAGNKT